jgi:hypothetical protein
MLNPQNDFEYLVAAGSGVGCHTCTWAHLPRRTASLTAATATNADTRRPAVRDTHFEIQIKVGGKNRGERFTSVALQKKATRGNKGKYCIKKRKFLPNESLAFC